MPGYFHKPYFEDNRTQITRPNSIFGVRPYTDNPVTCGTKWELLTDYIARKFVSRSQVRRFARKKWIAVSSFKNRLYVSELCPGLIDEWLTE
jgi:hypothetical protein